MKVYTVHVRHSGLDPDRDVVLIKEGLSWPAFFFSVLWALWKRLWLAALGLGLANVVLSGLVLILDLGPVGQLAVSLGGAAVIGYVGNDLWRWTLARRGFIEAGVVAAADRESALQRFLDSEPTLAREMAS